MVGLGERKGEQGRIGRDNFVNLYKNKDAVIIRMTNLKETVGDGGREEKGRKKKQCSLIV